MNPASTQKKTRELPYIGVAVLVWQGDKLLLGQRIDANTAPVWQFPGGHLESGETVLQCAAREVKEETGLEINHAEHAGFSNEMISMGEREYITLFVSSSTSGKPRVMEPDKCQSWQWFCYDQLPAPLFLPIINFLKQVPDLSVLRPPEKIETPQK